MSLKRWTFNIRRLLQSVRVIQSNALCSGGCKSRANSVSDRIYIPLSSEVERSFGSLHQETFTQRADSRALLHSLRTAKNPPMSEQINESRLNQSFKIAETKPTIYEQIKDYR